MRLLTGLALVAALATCADAQAFGRRRCHRQPSAQSSCFSGGCSTASSFQASACSNCQASIDGNAAFQASGSLNVQFQQSQAWSVGNAYQVESGQQPGTFVINRVQ